MEAETHQITNNVRMQTIHLVDGSELNEDHVSVILQFTSSQKFSI